MDEEYLLFPEGIQPLKGPIKEKKVLKTIYKCGSCQYQYSPHLAGMCPKCQYPFIETHVIVETVTRPVGEFTVIVGTEGIKK